MITSEEKTVIGDMGRLVLDALLCDQHQVGIAVLRPLELPLQDCKLEPRLLDVCTRHGL